ncbi:zinc-binding dehydrogenase [Phaeacidiphilus oryzae]|uniref:zinc-binding dehydrogenase n=1 Tax=Phaeacidiphilus oryzae TaxID=348818 RepID=UPI00055C782F|nr:zinc-binding dehydrogenase [Phaeacidiphilus oryzae]
MKAIAIQSFGSPDGLAVIDLPDPAPAPGQLLIATEAIGVGGVDAVIRRGTLPEYGFRAGHIPGSEVAGEVTAVGEGVDASWIGRRVWAFTGVGGGYVEQAVAAVEDVLPLPVGLAADDAVAIGGSGVVAHFALAHARFAPGESVLVRGAAGSIGITAVQLAARAGAGAVAVTTSSAERGARLRALGATHVLDRSGAPAPAADTPAAAAPAGTTPAADAPAAAAPPAAAPEGFDVVLDIVGGPGLPAFLSRLRPNGRMVALGIVGGQPPADFGTALLSSFQKSLTFATFSADTVPRPDRRAVRTEHFAAVAHGDLRAVVDDRLPLHQAALAHRRMDEGKVFGRIVLTP